MRTDEAHRPLSPVSGLYSNQAWRYLRTVV